MDRLIPLQEVETITGLKKPTIYNYIRQGKFPKQIKISKRAVRWSLQAIMEWMEKQKTAQDQ